MVKILLIRHGETDHNQENRMSGWTEATLSPRGIQQALVLGDRLRHMTVDRIITSGMMRATETAKLVFPHGAGPRPFEVMASLKEMHFGTMEGMTMDDIQQRYPKDFQIMMEMKGRYTFPQGESLYTFHHRIRQAGKRLLENQQAGVTAVVAHSGTIRSLLAGWIAKDWRAHWRFQIDHCSLTVVTFQEGFPVLCLCNDTTHLTDPLKELP